MSFGQNLGSGMGPPSKVAIPRLERPGETSYRHSGTNRHRVQRACVTCRTRKVKCNGVQPCQNCRDNDTACVYISSRKDRLRTATNQNQDMIKILKDLLERVGTVDRKRIESVLAGVVEDVADAALSIQKSPETKRFPDQEEERGEALASAEVGSNEDLDLLDEDLLSSEQSRATGFIGKNSEIQWFRRLHHDVDRPAEDGDKYEGPYGPPGDNPNAAAQRPPSQLSNFNFYLDDEKLETDSMVDPLELPPFAIAEKLFNCYMQSVQTSFPILAERIFRNQFYHFYASVGRGTPINLPEKWQAILNLVFAVGAVYSHLTEANWRGDERDHVIYHSRASILGLRDPSWVSNPDLLQMQIIGLLSLYYLAIGHINKAWVVIGISVRLAYALGLHVRNEDRSTSAVRKETLVRMWWGLYSLERVLSAVSGRPSVVHEVYCSVPLPLPLSTEEMDEATVVAHLDSRARKPGSHDLAYSGTGSTTSSRKGSSIPAWSLSEPSNSGSFLNSWAKLGMITHNTIIGLYSARLVSKSWEDVQKIIVELSQELETWASNLPPGFNFSLPNSDQIFRRERLILEMYYQSTRILITRSCLCRLDRRIENQSEGSNNFNKRTAQSCISAAISVAQLFPDKIEPAKLYQMGPWWSVVHSLMQGLAILLLELSYEVTHSTQEYQTIQDCQQIASSLHKLMRWLKAMAQNNATAKRAYSVVLGLVQKVIKNVKPEIAELLRNDTKYTPTFEPQASSFSARKSPVLAEESSEWLKSGAGKNFSIHPHDITMNPCEYETTNRPGIPQAKEGFSRQADTPAAFQDFLANTGPLYSIFTHLFTTTHDEQNPLPFATTIDGDQEMLNEPDQQQSFWD
ncbi:uncharacterized protein BDR25DRAFT_277719 [Lindgomyces ingoldianus]|uniref:Uncharacterized protein n=1 Tax=Lindgomyces ingoldianus TaxID=673940 RepID=A0ACB6RDX2_9PLEO|nr:uncharacterized protein BDR25DRAFT_277719 [Lindgomyces ingoldianus]KAF2476525.1 hypothetical protein BDR25DRAFT_277719 [Lindgomyces ingoldianus]